MKFSDLVNQHAGTTSTDVENINKAIEAGAGYAGAPTSLTGGGVLQVESLDSSLKSVTHELKHLKLWPTLYQGIANNTIEEYNRIDSFGDNWNGFVSESGLPRSTDASYSRQIQRVRFIGVTREVSYVHTLVKNAHGDAIGMQVENGVKKILEMTERGLFNARGHYSNNGKFDGSAAILEADLGWEGLDKQIRFGDSDPTAKAKAFAEYGDSESVVVDMRGKVIDEDYLEDTARIIGQNFGVPNQLHLDNKSHSDLSRQFYPKQRINQMGVSNGSAGYVLNSFTSAAGEFSLISNVFLRPKAKQADALHSDAPAQPTGVAASDANSKFVSSDAGNYIYYATAIKEVSAQTSGAGEGTKSLDSAVIAVAAGQKVTLTIPAVVGAFAYAVYRSKKDGTGSTAEFIGYVAPTVVGGAATFIDLNHKIPGAAQAYLLSNESDQIEFKKLSPLVKMDLARLGPVYRWLQLLYGMPVVFAPRKHALMENIGKAV